MHPKYYPASPMLPYAPPYPPVHQHGPGFCRSCCHPIAQCVCHRDCRKIEKELLVEPKSAVGKPPADGTAASDIVFKRLTALMTLITPEATDTGEEKSVDTGSSVDTIRLLQSQLTSRAAAYGMQSTVIGGGCCVHLSMEYMPLTPLANTPALSAALVMDSKGTMMAWGKYFTEDGYHVKEGVISTNPGAYLWVISLNSVTRVRWCEIVSC